MYSAVPAVYQKTTFPASQTFVLQARQTIETIVESIVQCGRFLQKKQTNNE